MRFLVKIPVPSAAEHPAGPDLAAALQALYRQLRTQANYSTDQEGHRVDYILADIEPAQMTTVARQIFQLTQAKVEFLPENVPQKSYGHTNK